MSKLTRTFSVATFATLVGCIAAAIVPAESARAQTFPNKPVTILVGFAPAGPLDWMARVMAPKLQERWGQPVIVENRPGAGGLVAAQALQKAPADGYIIMPHTSQIALYPLFVKSADIEPGRNIQPLVTVFYTPYVLMVNSQLPVKNLRELIAYAKANPGKLNAALAINTGHYLDSLAFAKAAGIDIAPIGYNGGAATTTALLANESQLSFTSGGMQGHLQAGKVVAIAVTSSSRFSIFPDVPTMKEAAGLDFVRTLDFGYFTTQGTPRAVVDKLSRDITEAMASADVKEAIRKQGFDPVSVPADQWLSKMAEELRVGKEMARQAKMEPQ